MSCRREYLFEIEECLSLDELVLLCHVWNQWLSILPTLQHLVTIQEAVEQLLLVDLPKTDMNYKQK